MESKALEICVLKSGKLRWQWLHELNFRKKSQAVEQHIGNGRNEGAHS